MFDSRLIEQYPHAGTGNTSPAYMEWLARQLDSRQNHVSGLLSLAVTDHIKPGVEAVLMEVIKSQMETNELLRNALTGNWKYPNKKGNTKSCKS